MCEYYFSNPRRGSRIDLHLHTTNSDGELSPYDLVCLANKRNLSVISICDHEYFTITQVQKYNGTLIIPGIELSAQYTGPDGRKTEVHILGLFPDNVTDPSSFTEITNRLQEENRAYTLAMLEKLKLKSGIELGIEDVVATAKRSRIGRYEIALRLLQTGLVPDLNSAFEHLSQSYIPKSHYIEPPQLETVVKLSLANGGIPVLAHPLSYVLSNEELEQLISVFRQTALERPTESNSFVLAGLEVYYQGYSEEQISHLKRLQNRYGLLASAGSDRHGKPQPFCCCCSGFRIFENTLLALASFKARKDGIRKLVYSSKDPMDRYREYPDNVQQDALLFTDVPAKEPLIHPAADEVFPV